MNRRALAAGLALLGAALAGCSAGTEEPGESGSAATTPATTAPETTAVEETPTAEEETTTAQEETTSEAPEEETSGEATSEDPFAELDAATGTGTENLTLPDGFALPDGAQVGSWQRGAGAYTIEITSPELSEVLAFYRTWLPANGYSVDTDVADLISFSKNGDVGTITALTGSPTITYAAAN